MGGIIFEGLENTKNQEDPLKLDYQNIVQAITQGNLIFFLGSDINLHGRQVGISYQQNSSSCAPSHDEIAQQLINYLQSTSEYNLDGIKDLCHISQYYSAIDKTTTLYDNVRTLFNTHKLTNSLYDLLASLPNNLQKSGYQNNPLLIITANFDELLEHAFEKVGQPYNLINFVKSEQGISRFYHRSTNGKSGIIKTPNRHIISGPDPIIVKLYGTFERLTTTQDDYILTEDNLINYMAEAKITQFLPISIFDKLKKRDSRFLFLAYNIRKWSSRVILNRIWGDQKFLSTSWAVQFNPQPMDKEFWRKRNVTLLPYQELEIFVKNLDLEIQNFFSLRNENE